MHLVLSKGAKLGSIKDLKGKRVGIGQAGSGTQIAVMMILEDNGIERDDIKPAELNNSQSAERIADEMTTCRGVISGKLQLTTTLIPQLHQPPLDRNDIA